ncbi:MAG: M20/M25/M40 family metallo-hydrolase [Sporomusaceae bacterium]|nr:M20/M25/M40 family metallo-hydrolase [Sporomusaceae bacterium]
MSCYTISPEVASVYTKLKNDPSITTGIAFLESDATQTVANQKTLTEIAAPPFAESTRAAYYLSQLKQLGLTDLQSDSEGSVFGTYKGSGQGPTLFVSAHLDTVFPADTDVTVKEIDGRLYAPGIADDARGLAAILTVIRALRQSNIATEGDIIFGGTVGEEGLGNLRGVKNFFAQQKNIDGFITIDGTSPNHITYLATGSRRYEIIYHGPGGHSFNHFGQPSATHALGRAISKIANLVPPTTPKTTFTIGTITGGTSINSIAEEASMTVDIRSDSEAELKKLEENIIAFADKAAVEENLRWNSQDLTVQLKLIGDRPAASQPKDLMIVQSAWAAADALQLNPALSSAGSTDANYPMSLGIPSLRLGGGGDSGQGHSLGEWFDPTNAFWGPQTIFLTVLGLVGVKDLTAPLLPHR